MAIKILKQNEDGSYQWVNLTGSGGGGGGSLDELEVDYTDNNNISNYTGDKSLVVTTPQTGTKRINIQYEGSVGANAYGRKYVQNSEPTSPNNGDIWYDTSGDVASSGIKRIATIKDQRSNSLNSAIRNGGKAFEGRNIRVFNTLDDPKGIGISLLGPDTNPEVPGYDTSSYPTVIKVPAGTYSIKWTAPAYNVREHNTVLIYSPVQPETATSDTASTTKVQGSAEWAGYSNTAGLDYPQTCSKGVIASVTFTQTNYIRLEHYVRTAMDTYGLGVATWGGAIPADIFGDSVYAQIEIEDLSTAIKDAAPAPADVPIGGIIMWSGTKTALDALTNWVMCDDSAAAVAAGAPDLRDKFIIGAHSFSDEGDGKWETNVTGSGTQSGGHKNAVLLAHEHKAPTWNGVSSGGFESGWTTGGYDYGTQAPPTEKTAIDADGNITTGDSATQTGDNANLPPYWALAYIMKIS